jgi:hypothetical protein
MSYFFAENLSSRFVSSYKHMTKDDRYPMQSPVQGRKFPLLGTVLGTCLDGLFFDFEVLGIESRASSLLDTYYYSSRPVYMALVAPFLMLVETKALG